MRRMLLIRVFERVKRKQLKIPASDEFWPMRGEVQSCWRISLDRPCIREINNLLKDGSNRRCILCFERDSSWSHSLGQTSAAAPDHHATTSNALKSDDAEWFRPFRWHDHDVVLPENAGQCWPLGGTRD